MAEKKKVQDMDGDEIVARAKDFWEKYNKPVMIISVAIIVLVGGWYGYQNFVVKPKENKAADALFRAETYYRMDS
ncbi:MAG: hypothetical protein KDB99_13210, partial [Chitinophagaceae bacterium]|nr:hypothetical protein [Chitinophagaceae bacterium]